MKIPPIHRTLLERWWMARRSVVVAAVLGWSLVGRAGATPITDTLPILLTGLSLDLRVDYSKGTLAGAATLEVRNTAHHPVRQIPLLLNRLMTVSRITAPDGHTIPFTQRTVLYVDDSTLQVNALTVSAEVLRPGDTGSIIVHYSGTLVGYTETGSLYIKDHVSPEFTIIREDAFAFPVIGMPSRAANRAAPREPFQFTARITVPRGQVVAMGGERIGSIPQDSEVVWSYRASGPVPFLNIAIAPYATLETGGVRIFYFSADSAGARVVGQAVGQALERLRRWYGPLGREPRLTIMEIPEGYGSQASLTAGILQTADAFQDRSQLRQLYHELSHLWNVTDGEHPSPRWNEGLASFLERRLAAELDGQADWHATLERTARRIEDACAPHVGCDRVPLVGYGRAGLTDLSYSVGAVTFYALYTVLGPDDFDRAYRDFYQRFKDSSATSADLAAAFHDVNPQADKILEDWLLTPRWYARLRAGESVEQVVESYRRP